MGLVLPKPILSKNVDRLGNEFVYSGSAGLNGFRNSMEDAHMMCADSATGLAYFGIFDGHSNEKCSIYVAERMPDRLRKLKEPITADQLEKVCVALDTEFTLSNPDGGSTGTFCIVRKSGKVTIANVGDSRILVTRGAAVVFETEDHKPYDPAERDRIVACGGSVIGNRVDGDLAVSRAFGDACFKVRNAADYRQQKVIAVPDVTDVNCQPGDVIVIACDGVFEGNFSNAEVARFVHEQMAKCWDDIAVVAARVCDEAIRRGSKDNISCMVIKLAPGTSQVKTFGATSFLPGPPFPRNHEGCRTAYTRMAALSGLSCAQALQQRYELLLARDKKTLAEVSPPVLRTAFEMSDDVDVETERQFFGRGPARGNEKPYFEALASGSN